MLRVRKQHHLILTCEDKLNIFTRAYKLDASNCLPLSHSVIPALYELIPFNSQTSSLLLLLPECSVLRALLIPGACGSYHVCLAQPQLCQDTHSHSVRVYNVLFSSWSPPPHPQGVMVVNRYLQNNPRTT